VGQHRVFSKSARGVWLLLELEGVSYKEIAGVQDVRIGTVMSRLTRARHRLRESLSRDLPNGTVPESQSTNTAHGRHRQTEQESQSIIREIEFTNENADLWK
jgi:Sigma-70, region 4